MAAGKRGDTALPGGAEGADRVSFDRAYTELRPALFALAYRITGNRADAEEIVQDTFVRLHDAGAKDTVRSLKAYLATITARLSFNRLRDRRTRSESYVGEWLPEPLVMEDDPGLRAEDVSFALLVVLERLSPAERVVFVLRHAFELPFEEIAPVVGRDVVTCRKIFSRARARVAEERPRFAVDRKRHLAVMEKFREAARGQDMSGLLQLLDENVILHGDGGGKAFAAKKPVSGRLAVAQFLLAVIRTLPPQAEVEELELNGAPALVVRTAGRISVAIMIDTDGDRIRSIFGVSNPDKLEAIARGAGAGPIAEIERYS
jgi:RNA polymerase sigma-70 factor (ECF subfamily)